MASVSAAAAPVTDDSGIPAAIVIDSGTATIKLGLVGGGTTTTTGVHHLPLRSYESYGTPSVVLPTSIGRGRAGMKHLMGQHTCYFGDEAQTKRHALEFTKPIERGTCTTPTTLF